MEWKTLVILTSIGLLIVSISGCVEESTPPSSTSQTQTVDPSTTIQEFVTAYNNRDANKLYSLFSTKIKSEYPREKIESQLELAKSFGIKITEYKVENKEISNDVANLKVTITSYMGGKTYKEVIEFSLVYENGRWLIDNWPWKEHEE